MGAFWDWANNLTENRTDRILARQERKGDKQMYKYGAQSVAYQNGMQPVQSTMWNNIGGMGTSLIQNAPGIISTSMGMPSMGGMGGSSDPSAPAPMNNNMMMIGGAVLLLVLLIGRRK